MKEIEGAMVEFNQPTRPPEPSPKPKPLPPGTRVPTPGNPEGR